MRDEMGRNPVGILLSSGVFGSSSTSGDSHQDDDVAEEEHENQSEAQASGWNFGGFIKTLAAKSGGVLQAYQHDLQEFGIGLKKETETITGVTAHVVKDLPHSLETGASVAHESLENVGQTLEEFGSSVWRGTTEIFAQVKEAVLKADEEAGSSASLESQASTGDLSGSLSNTKYSRYEAQVHAMQRDTSTYCDEPEDGDDFAAFVATFNMDERKEEIDEIVSSNTFMQELQNRIVPVVVELDVFWTRYFYRIHKLQQIEHARAILVKRATEDGEDEDLSWDVDEEKEPEETSPPSEPKVEDRELSEVASAVSNSETSAAVHSVEDTREEEEAKSEGSAGSEWLVVSEDKNSGSSEPKSPPSSPVAEIKEIEASVPIRAEEREVDEAELDEIGELSIEDESRGPKPKPEGEKGTTSKGPGTAAGEENEEDWGEWE